MKIWTELSSTNVNKNSECSNAKTMYCLCVFFFQTPLPCRYWRVQTFLTLLPFFVNWYSVTFRFCLDYHQALNSLRPSDAIWRQWSWTTLAQVMACCLTAPSHYLNQCWLIIRGVLWHTSESSFAGIAQGIDSGYEFEKDILKNIFKSPRGQWVNGSTLHLWTVDIVPRNMLASKHIISTCRQLETTGN